MTELSDELCDQISADLELGDKAMGEAEYSSAKVFYQQALDKLPKEKTDWEIALQVYTALGDCNFNLKEYQEADFCYNKALMCPGGTGNAYVWLGVGQSCFALQETEKAKKAFMSAYMLDGRDIFEGEDRKYFSLIKELV